jgi:putative phage-type endonuclease
MRRIVELTQATDDWLAWRRGRVTASNVPVILLESDFQTPLQLWEGYINPSNNPSTPNLAMQRGTALEGVVRDEYMLHAGREFIPICVENTDYPFLGASLDGYSDDEGGIVLEIKVPSQEKHQQALKGEVPLCYRGQLQCQLMVTGASRAEYVSYDYKDKSWAKVVVYPDPVYFERIAKAASEFMEMVKSQTRPQMTDRDFIEADSEDLKNLMTAYSEKKGLLDQLSDELDALKEGIRNAMKHTRVRFGNMRASILERKGNVDYRLVKELRGVDLEQYRKPNTKYLDIRFSKSEAS